MTSGPIPLRPLPKASSRDQLGWRAVGQHGSVSAKKRPDQRKAYSRWALRSQHFSLFAGNPAIQQVKTDDGWIFKKMNTVKRSVFEMERFWSGFPLTARMARDMSDKEILKMELEQLKKEVNTARTPVSKWPVFVRQCFLLIRCCINLHGMTTMLKQFRDSEACKF